MTNKMIFILFVFTCSVLSCQSKFVIPPNMEMGAKFIQGIVTFCINLHKTDLNHIIKTYNNEENERNAKCAIMCILQSAQVMNKEGKFVVTDVKKALENFPDVEKRTEVLNTINECIQQDSEDDCEKAFLFTKCISKIQHLIPVNTIHSVLELFKN